MTNDEQATTRSGANRISETDNKSCKAGEPVRSLRDVGRTLCCQGEREHWSRRSGGSSGVIATAAGRATYVLLIPYDTAEVDSESATIGSLVR